MRSMVLSLLFAALLPRVAEAQVAAPAVAYPSKPVKLITPFPPGGAADAIARAVASSLQAEWKQTVVVDNRPGAGGTIGAEALARSGADPHTLFIGSIGVMTVNPHIYRQIRYDAAKDFTPISMLLTMPSFLVVNANNPARNVREFLEQARARPGMTYGSAGSGTTEHTNAAMLADLTGIQVTHVPYKGIAPSLTDLLGGQIDFIVEQSVAILPMIRAGKVRALAVTTAQRTPLLPDVPTLAESGVPGFDASAWYALYAPAGIPAAAQQQIHDGLVKAFDTPEMRKRFAEIGGEVATTTPEALARFQAAESVKWAEVVKRSGIRLD